MIQYNPFMATQEQKGFFENRLSVRRLAASLQERYLKINI